MADGFALALQVATRSALIADAGVAALVGARVYDEPPAGVTMPYLRFGEISPRAFDTDSKEGARVQIGLHAHSTSAAGRVEALKIVEAVRGALHRKEASLTVAGYTLVELIFQTFVATRDAEGRGYSATISLQATLEE